MLIVIDIGNSCIKAGMYAEDVLIDKATFVYSKNINQELFEKIFKTIFDKKNISNCYIASVSDEVTEIVKSAIQNVCNVHPFIVNTDLNLGINIRAKHPNRIGIDRVINGVAASKLYSYPVIVVDFGTATTFDIVNSDGDFIGGLILPGIYTQLKSLASGTSKLPEIDLKEMEKVQNTINTDTVKAILSGVVKGHAHAIEGLIKDCTKEMKVRPKIIATGGDAEFIAKYMNDKVFDVINQNLTLQGIKMIYDLNMEE